MSLKAQSYRPDGAPKIKHLFLAAEAPRAAVIEYAPYFFIEARIDFGDIRTGFNATVNVNNALEIYSNDADLLWTNDMVQEVDTDKAGSTIPDYARLRSLPEFVGIQFASRMETQFIQYLLRSYKARVYKNFALNIYSSHGESRSEFISRCLELFDESIRQDLDLEHEVFDRKLEQIKEKYMGAADFREAEPINSASQNTYYRVSERIAELFLNAVSNSAPTAGACHYPQGTQEIEERLVSLEWEAQQAVDRLLDSYKAKAQHIDEYIIHPNLKDIHIVRSCILWMPVKAE